MSVLEQPKDNPQLPIEQDEVSLEKLYKDSAALKLVVQDHQRCEAWLNSKMAFLRWRECQTLFESPTVVDTWEGTDIPKSSISVFTLAQHTQAIIPQVMNGLFADDPPFLLRPRSGTKLATVRASTELLQYQLEDCEFREQLQLGVLGCLTFGTAIWKWGWESTSRKRLHFERKEQPIQIETGLPEVRETINTPESDEFEIIEEDEFIDRPLFDFIPLREVFVDPGLRQPDIRKAKFVIHRMKVSAAVLDDLREVPGFDIPKESKMMDLLFPPVEDAPKSSVETNTNVTLTMQGVQRDEYQTLDPLERDGFELLERWDNGKVITILNRKLVIRNERNPYGRIPFCSVNFINVPNSFYGLGLGHTIGHEQLVQQGLINARLDEVAINLNLPFIRVKGSNVPTQNIRLRPAGIIDVDNKDALKPMERIQAVPEAYMEVRESQARAEAMSGANELMVQGNMPDTGRSSITKTATGSNLLAAAAGARIEDFVTRIAVQVFEPTLYAFHEMNGYLLPLDTLRRILDEELQVAFNEDHMTIKNAKMVFEVAPNVASRRKLEANFPMFLQTLLTDPLASMLQGQGKKLNANELVNMMYDVYQFRNKRELIVDLSDEDEQRAAMNNPMVQKVKAQKEMLRDETDAKLEILDSENSARAYREMMREGIRDTVKGKN